MADKHGYKRGRKASAQCLRGIRKELSEWLDSPEGEYALQSAPRCMLYTVDNDNVIGHEKRKDLVLDLLMREFGGGGSG
jgi:hypothetical protein